MFFVIFRCFWVRNSTQEIEENSHDAIILMIEMLRMIKLGKTSEHGEAEKREKRKHWSWANFTGSSREVKITMAIIQVKNLRKKSIVRKMNLSKTYSLAQILVIHAPFHATGYFLYLLKTSYNLWFSYIFRGYI